MLTLFLYYLYVFSYEIAWGKDHELLRHNIHATTGTTSDARVGAGMWQQCYFSLAAYFSFYDTTNLNIITSYVCEKYSPEGPNTVTITEIVNV